MKPMQDERECIRGSKKYLAIDPRLKGIEFTC